VEQGVPEALARRHAFQPAMVHAPDATRSRSLRPPRRGRRARPLPGRDRAELGWLERQIEGLPVNGRMQRWAQHALRDDVLRLRRDLVYTALADTEGDAGVEAAVDAFLPMPARPRSRRLGRFVRTLAQEARPIWPA
jgi:glutamate dehydrogenase